MILVLLLLTDGRIEDDVDYKLYYIVFNEGGEMLKCRLYLVAYKRLNPPINEVFDLNNFGVWFSFPESSVSKDFRVCTNFKVKTEESHVKTVTVLLPE